LYINPGARVSADRRIARMRLSPQDEPMDHVTIYTRARCIWCFLAKRLLRNKGIAFEEKSAADAAVRSYLLERTGRRTVPQVFFGQASIGGYEDLKAQLAR
jgi:glutaredoxin 3